MTDGVTAPTLPPLSTIVSTDGRRARRDRNITTVLDAAVELFSDDNVVPTMDQIAARAGLSLRSLYRYFPDADTLIAAAIAQTVGTARRAATITDVGSGTFSHRLDRFVEARIALHLALTPVIAATLHHAVTNQQLREALHSGRAEQRAQFEHQFAPEIDALRRTHRDELVAAADLAAQVESIELLRSVHTVDAAQRRRVLRETLATLLSATD
ncbi:MAG: TetR/AcrR family transcriptional regulator [Ilumatobacteraceae bacterium]